MKFSAKLYYALCQLSKDEFVWLIAMQVLQVVEQWADNWLYFSTVRRQVYGIVSFSIGLFGEKIDADGHVMLVNLLKLLPDVLLEGSTHRLYVGDALEAV